MPENTKAPKHFRPEPFAYHEVIELEIDSLSNLGMGLGRIDRTVPPGSQSERGWVVFVPFCLPGERVRARIWKNEAGCSHADLLEILHGLMEVQGVSYEEVERIRLSKKEERGGFSKGYFLESVINLD